MDVQIGRYSDPEHHKNNYTPSRLIPEATVINHTMKING